MNLDVHELDATDHVHDLADRNAISTAIADRLDDNGFETVADLLIADVSDLEDVPYIGGQRAAAILEAVDAVEKPSPEPREVDFETTESVVSEAAIPLSVRRGEAVLTASGASGTNGVYHTTDCSVVRGKGENLRERDWTWVEERELDECGACRDPDILSNPTDSREESDLETSVDSREAVLEANLGEKLNLTMAERDGYASPWYVIDAPAAIEWDGAMGGTWRTRRLRIADGIRESSRRECDLILGAGEIRIEDPPTKRRSAQPNAPGWRVESVRAVGRASPSSFATLRGQKQEQETKPDGDDTWRQYQNRGEMA